MFLVLAMVYAGCAPAPIDETRFVGQWRYPETGEAEVPPRCRELNQCRLYSLALNADHTFTMSITVNDDTGCLRGAATVRGPWFISRGPTGQPQAFLPERATCEPTPFAPIHCNRDGYSACQQYKWGGYEVNAGRLERIQVQPDLVQAIRFTRLP